MMMHSADYLEMFSTLVVGWMWLLQAAVARESRKDDAFYQGKLAAAQYWMRAELPRVSQLARLCLDAEDSYARARSEWF
jgi:butyryl-CoA dehydrogenase